MFIVTKNHHFITPKLRNFVRGITSNDQHLDKCSKIENRNPRNLEFIRIARRPAGWKLDEVSRQYWHKLVFTKTSRFLTLELHHFENGPVISISTKDWPLKIQLHKLRDTAAHIKLGRLMAQRCLESGITCMMPMESENVNTKLDLLLQELRNSGIILREPSVLKTPFPWDKKSEEKPWENVP